MATTTNKLSGRTVTLGAARGRKITPETVEAALKQIYKLSGCLACGLIGFDIRILGGDPAPVINEIEGFNVNVR